MRVNLFRPASFKEDEEKEEDVDDKQQEERETAQTMVFFLLFSRENLLFLPFLLWTSVFVS